MTRASRQPPEVLIVHTGGTIGMDEHLRLPSLNPRDLRERLLSQVPELTRLARCEIEVAMNRDSAHIGPEEWVILAKLLQKKISEKKYSGIVVLHGTDTLAYTASAMSFLIRPCPIPVIMTGAQRPLASSLTDARRNLISSVEMAAHGPRKLLSQVLVFFDDRLIQGNQARKKSASDFGAFDAPKSRPLAWVGTDIRYARGREAKIARTPVFKHRFESRIALMHLTPGFPGRALTDSLLTKLKGICLIPFASGTGPTNDPDFIRFLRRARAKRVPLILVTDSETVADHARGKALGYEAGRALTSEGCFWGKGMTPECAFVKASLLLGQPGMTVQRFARLWDVELAGENG